MKKKSKVKKSKVALATTKAHAAACACMDAVVHLELRKCLCAVFVALFVCRVCAGTFGMYMRLQTSYIY